MARSKIQQTIRKSAEGVLDLSEGSVRIEVENIGAIDFTEVFSKFDGELVKVVVSVSNEGIGEDNGDGD